ncbi:hypothetical protein ACISOU_08660, partial [Campylobacter jejuni]
RLDKQLAKSVVVLQQNRTINLASVSLMLHSQSTQNMVGSHLVGSKMYIKDIHNGNIFVLFHKQKKK